MAVYGFGAMYEGKYDKKNLFIQNECACIGWAEQDAPGLHQKLKKVKILDVAYIKSFVGSQKTLTFKAIGLVTSDDISDRAGLGQGIGIKWIWQGEEKVLLSDAMYKDNVYNNTLYEEYNPEIQQKVMGLILSQLR